ncbi:MAG: hypothetical protein GXY94_12720 [Bacteroidales bacterium]|jgi:hypothetical protein|nr:hypothetical protein [Bacteroidales bacterium]
MVYKNEKVVGQRKNRACKLIPINKVDMFVEIPEDYRCDAYEISPSGDMFWADKRNVEKVKKAIESKDQIAARLYSADDIKDFLKSL